jgi:hypothetical protein
MRTDASPNISSETVVGSGIKAAPDIAMNCGLFN